MSDASIDAGKYAPGTHPDLPPPVRTTGAWAWVRMNLFGSPLNIVMTVLAAWLLWSVIPPIFEWAVWNSVWTAESRNDCWAKMAVPEC